VANDSYTINCGYGISEPTALAAGSQPTALAAGEPSALAAGVSSGKHTPDGADPYKFSHQDSVYGGRAYFESTESDRLNEAHWLMTGPEAPVNDALLAQLPVMRLRSNHEAINNPTIEGLILSHTLAVAGENGPLLDIWGENDADDRWCTEAEEVWEEWCAAADAAGDLSLGSLIKQWNVSCWRNGEWLEQLVTEEDRFLPRPDAISLRLHGIELQRLSSPYADAANPDVVMGIRRNRYRRPVDYHIVDTYNNPGSNGRWIPAAQIVHGMDRVQAERGQARGIPWAQSGLPISADLRDYDTQVLDAARAAADNAIFAFTRHPDAEFADNVPASVEYRRRRLNHLAPGWELGTLPSHQPGATYREHRHERMGDLGKTKGVPSMITRLDARDHNYSSARFDYQLLGESAKHVRSTLYNPTLIRLATLVLSEARLAGRLRPRPKRIWMELIWPALPEIDELKSAKAEQLYLQIGTVAYTDACSNRHGRRARDVIRRRERDERMLVAAGLPTIQEATGNVNLNATIENVGDQ